MMARPDPADALLGALQAHFDTTDALRRLQGNALASFGLAPREAPYQVTAQGAYWRLRDYGGSTADHSLLIIAAPIKRPYIWDLAPSLSPIRFCLEQKLRVRLLEWLPASQADNDVGLEECIEAISCCVMQVSQEDKGSKAFLAGHSLGGTLAAIYAANASESVRGLILLSAPLCFEPEQGGFRDALIAMLPPQLPANGRFPGSLLTHMSALASPGTFVWSRLFDGLLSLTDEHAAEVHARVECWALDEVALPGKLVKQIVECLYRDNRFFRETLRIGARLVGPSTLRVPVLAVVNTADDIAPMHSLKPFADALPSNNARIFDFPGEIGVGLQHLAILVGREAKVTVWPEIIAWMKSCPAKDTTEPHGA